MKPTKVTVKLDTFEKDSAHGVRICFLYTDRGPDIFERPGFKTPEKAMEWGKGLVAQFVKDLPGATATEEPHGP